jgi:hypothetical protein
LLHRYQTDAAATDIGGLDFRYAVRGDGQTVTRLVPGVEQRKALAAVLKTLDPAALTLPEALLEKLPPRPPEYPRWRESFEGRTGPSFDPLGAAETSATATLTALFNADRATRLVEYHARDASIPSLADVIDETLKATWQAPRLHGLAAETQLTVDTVVLDHLLGLAASATASPQTKAIARLKVAELKRWLTGHSAQDSGVEWRAHESAALLKISDFERSPDRFKIPEAPLDPPGAPIGGGN